MGRIYTSRVRVPCGRGSWISFRERVEAQWKKTTVFSRFPQRPPTPIQRLIFGPRSFGKNQDFRESGLHQKHNQGLICFDPSRPNSAFFQLGAKGSYPRFVHGAATLNILRSALGKGWINPWSDLHIHLPHLLVVKQAHWLRTGSADCDGGSC
uniref:Uncharacterized protein n=1 Tax=Candidatus Kentrum sp. SD TaxID=2126332 RepID=A0A450YWB8_9GAMM|nr:MAG: hypothetical protein BECKSD772F_GA0070984_12582 [Candidatus Kentron sp. SD]VFK49773.1 MAG: hypothetical protein BECKSD772E_GA0070983_12372 [Candidatus Kentron sp. SD]